MVTTEDQTADDQLIEAWALVDELGAYSQRLMRAATAAHQALGLTNEEEPS